MFHHYFEVSGVPLINSEATEEYIRARGAHLPFRPAYRGDRIHVALEEPAYRSPLIDDAPWANPNDPASDDFFGLYPLNISGVGDSTLTSDITENMGPGGSVMRGREGSRTVKVSGLLVAASEQAAQLGLTWLRAAVRDDDCDTGDCQAGGASYFLAEPQVLEHAYSEEVGTLSRALGAQNKPGAISYRWTADEAPVAMPSRAHWELVATEGTSFTFGAKKRYKPATLQSAGPIQPYRVNYALNPTLRADLSGWDVQGSNATWYPTGGADDRSYGRVSPIPRTTLRTYGLGPYGVDLYGRSGGSTGYGVSITTRSLTDVPAGPIIASVALQGVKGQQVTLSLLDETGVVLSQQAVTIREDWDRYSVAGTSTGSFVQVLITSTKAVAFDQSLIEVGALAFPYFDGGLSSGEDYVAHWDSQQDTSLSIQSWTGIAEVCREDSDFRMFLNLLQGSLLSLRLVWSVRNEIPMNEQLQPWLRNYYDVTTLQGPQIIQEFGDGSGAWFIQVEMLFGVGNPFAFSPPKTVPIESLLTATYTDLVPVRQDDAWLVDPDCTPVTAPPVAPIILDDCIEAISVWQRHYYLIPAEDVADWAVSVPTLRFDTKTQSIRQVRVRFHPNPFGYDAQRVDPLGFCSEFVVSYLPDTARLEIDGASQSARASKTGKASVTANHLLYGTDGAPITWPELTCGISYVMTVDVPPSLDVDLFDLGLELQRRE